jgi:hypothetical protein
MSKYDDIKSQVREFIIRQDEFAAAANEFADRLLNRARAYLETSEANVTGLRDVLSASNQADDGFFTIPIKIEFGLPRPEIQHLTITSAFGFRPTRTGTEVYILERNRERDLVKKDRFLIGADDADFNALFDRCVEIWTEMWRYDPFDAEQPKLTPGFDLSQAPPQRRA